MLITLFSGTSRAVSRAVLLLVTSQLASSFFLLQKQVATSEASVATTLSRFMKISSLFLDAAVCWLCYWAISAFISGTSASRFTD